MNQTSFKDQVRTVVMDSNNINDKIRSFYNWYRFLFSMDIPGHYTCIFSSKLGNSRCLWSYRELESIFYIGRERTGGNIRNAS